MSDIRIYEPNHTQTPNIVFELMPKMSEVELKITMCVVRQTIGWHKQKDKISLSQMAERTGMGRSTVAQALRKSEILKQIIEVKKGGSINEYGLKVHPFKANEDSPESEPPDDSLVQNLNHPSPESEPVASPESGHTKETITKETLTKESARVNGVPVPGELGQVDGFVEMYEKYCEYMKQQHHSWPNHFATETDFQLLLELSSQGNDPIKVIRQTIQGRNKSFFPLRDFKSGEDPPAQKRKSHQEFSPESYLSQNAS